LGANGAGKTSTIGAICGLTKPAGGRVIYNDVDIVGLSAHRIVRSGLAQVPAGRKIFAPLSVEDNLLLGGYTTKRRLVLRSRLEKTYDLFPMLKDLRTRHGGLLSGGQQQMLAVGRALMSEPHLILLDEPSMGLAPNMVSTVFAGLRAVADQGVGILLVEQNVRAAFRIAEKAYVLEQGTIVKEGPVRDLAEDQSIADAYLGGRESQHSLPTPLDDAVRYGNDPHATFAL
jgi:branched-chain amino acid transport system ATP-binding protein